MELTDIKEKIVVCQTRKYMKKKKKIQTMTTLIFSIPMNKISTNLNSSSQWQPTGFCSQSFYDMSYINY